MKQSVILLLKKAENDLKDAKILYETNEASAEGICFHYIEDAKEAIDMAEKVKLFTYKKINL